jgi:hypothetical protein
MIEPIVFTGATRSNPARALRLVGYYECICGAIGLLVIASLAIGHSRVLEEPSWWLGLVLFGLLTAAGAGIARQMRFSIALSIALQACQIVFFSVGGTVWHLCAGPYCTVSVAGSHLRAFIGVDYTVSEGWGATGQPVVLGINFVPVIATGLLIWTLRHRRECSTTV